MIKFLGFGQILWDLTVNVDFDFLKELNIEVGGHRIVNYENIIEIKNKIESKNNSTMTIIKNSGGSAANLMSNLAKLGSNASFCGKLGRDEDGSNFMKILQEEGVKTFDLYDEQKATGQIFSLVTPDKDRTFIVFRGASDFIPANLIDENLIRQFDIVHIEGYLIPDSREALLKIFENSHQNTFDLAAYSVTAANRGLIQNMLKKHPPYILFSNIFEGEAFTQQTKPMNILDEMIKYSEIAILTNGEYGVRILTDKGEQHYQPSVKTEVMDTTGAGDSFCAGFLHEFFRSKDIVKATELGTKTASLTIAEIGARSFQKSMLIP